MTTKLAHDKLPFEAAHDEKAFTLTDGLDVWRILERINGRYEALVVVLTPKVE